MIDFEDRLWPRQEPRPMPRNKVRIDFEALRRATLNRLHPEVLMILDCPYHGPVPHKDRVEIITSSEQTQDHQLTQKLLDVLDETLGGFAAARLTSTELYGRLQEAMESCRASPVRSVRRYDSRAVLNLDPDLSVRLQSKSLLSSPLKDTSSKRPVKIQVKGSASEALRNALIDVASST
ncbi:hypothetical protein PG984_007061 [Apiospora sp. TS-2023a]